MNKKKILTATKSSTIEQIVSAEISGGIDGVRYSDGEEKLHNAKFSEIKVKGNQSNQFCGKAPLDDINLFLFLEYIPTITMRNVPFKIYLINRNSKHLIDHGRIMFVTGDDIGSRVYSMIGENVNFWDITTKSPSSEILVKLLLFQDNKMTIKFSDDDAELREGQNTDIKKLTRSIDPIARLFERCPPFHDFIMKKCNGSMNPMVISVAIREHLKERGIEISTFIFSMREAHPSLFYHLVALENLHPDLIPFVNITEEDAIKLGGKRIIIEIAGLLSRINKKDQVKIWNNVRGLGHKQYICSKIRNLIKKYS